MTIKLEHVDLIHANLIIDLKKVELSQDNLNVELEHVEPTQHNTQPTDRRIVDLVPIATATANRTVRLG